MAAPERRAAFDRMAAALHRRWENETDAGARTLIWVKLKVLREVERDIIEMGELSNE